MVNQLLGRHRVGDVTALEKVESRLGGDSTRKSFPVFISGRTIIGDYVNVGFPAVVGTTANRFNETLLRAFLNLSVVKVVDPSPLACIFLESFND